MTDVTHPAPAFSLREAAQLAMDRFGIVGRVTALDSERDQNFKLLQDDGSQWVLKIVNASEPASECEFQVALLDHLARNNPDVAAPRLMISQNGTQLTHATSDAGERHAVRLVSWLPGLPMAKTVRTPALLENLGRALGRLDCALQGFIHPGALRSFDWDIREAGAARQRLHHVPDVADRALVRGLLDHFDAAVAPRLAGLRAQVIHNDANDWNVLVDEDNHERIAGIIDFGDALYSPLIAEVAVACAYSILDLEDWPAPMRWSGFSFNA